MWSGHQLFPGTEIHCCVRWSVLCREFDIQVRLKTHSSHNIPNAVGSTVKDSSILEAQVQGREEPEGIGFVSLHKVQRNVQELWQTRAQVNRLSL